MKKLDYVIIIILAVIAAGFYAFMFSKISQNSNEIQILYKNEVIYEVSIDDEVDIIISGKENDEYITLTINQEVKKINTEKVLISFFNTIMIKDEVVLMKDASCENKNCMQMRLDKIFASPIVCTNGVVVTIKQGDFEIMA